MGRPTLFTFLSLAFSWAALGWVLIRAGRDTIISGWGKMFFFTLPVQATGHLLWELGESFGVAETLLRFELGGGEEG